MSGQSGAGNLALVVILPTAHRVTVKVTPNTTVLQVLEDACIKAGLNALDWDLRHYNRIIELTNSVRFSGLPNNATLEMVQTSKPRKESTVKLGLQLESGKRLMEQFRPTQTLWEVLQHWKNSGENVLPTESQTKEEVQPVCIYMRNEIVGQEKLQAMTLRSLGLTQGSAIIRVLHRSENQLRQQANVSAPLSKSNTKVENDGLSTPTTITTSQNTDKSSEDSSRNCTTPKKMDEPVITTTDCIKVTEPKVDSNKDKSGKAVDLSKTEKSSITPMELDPDPVLVHYHLTAQPKPSTIANAQTYSKTGEHHVLGDRNAVIYHSDDVIVERYDDGITDEFFEVTMSDVDSIYRDLKNKRIALEEAPLLSSTQRASERDNAILKSIRDHPMTIVRIRFANRCVLQGTFRTLETIGAVVEFIRQYLVNPDLDFYLFTAPPKKVLAVATRLIEEGLVGLAVVYFGCSIEENNYLKPLKFSDPSVVFENLRFAQRHENNISENTQESSTDDTEQMPDLTSTVSSTLSHNMDQRPGTSAQSAQNSVSVNKRNQTVSGKVPKWFKR